MKEYLDANSTAYTAVTVVSPMVQGEERKDQDRARWFGPGQTACICDGVSSSPNAVKAAELATSFAPVLFDGNVRDNIRLLCGLFMSLRQECQESMEINMPEGTPESMRPILQKVAQNKKAFSFQTTLIAAQFSADDKTVLTQIVKCGDSAIFAFSPEGELLTSSLTLTSQCNSKSSNSVHQTSSQSVKRIHFGPGHEILVRVGGPLSEYNGLAPEAGINPEHARNWIVCSPIDSCQDKTANVQNLLEEHSLVLQLDNRLIIPKYLYGKHLTCEGHQYRVLRYSSAIKHVPRSGYPPLRANLGDAGSTTLVLPDHFYTGDLECYRDTFPLQTHFLLCSDGFYRAFPDWSELYMWLKSNSAALAHVDSRQMAVEQIHERLRATKGDDDISFIWVVPKDSQTEGERQVNHVG